MALVGLMQTLAIEGERHGIRVNCLAPSAATQMTQGVLTETSLRLLDPALVSPGLLALVGDDAPTRSILCAGAGHFSTHALRCRRGRQIGATEDAGEQVIAHWQEISDPTDEITPAYGFTQVERELQSAGIGSADIVAQR